MLLSPRRACSTARSARLMSWRMLPGQGACTRFAASPAPSVGGSQPYSSANCTVKCENSVRMSSPRARSGGASTISPARRK